jgi:hypothetical protein
MVKFTGGDKMQLRPLAAIGLLLSAFSMSSAHAHHSNAMFDRQKEVTIAGTVREFQWTNPHIFIELVVDGPNGPANYSVEGPAPGVLRDHGWKFSSLKPGDKVVVKVHPLKDNRQGGGLISVSKNGVVIGDSVPAPGYETPK